jgi:hypothetical protein
MHQETAVNDDAEITATQNIERDIVADLDTVSRRAQDVRNLKAALAKSIKRRVEATQVMIAASTIFRAGFIF